MNKFFWFFLILSMIFSLSLKAEEKIAFIDLDMIINQSEYGKDSFKKIDNEYEKEKKKLLSIEKKLLSKENEILKQKNILSEEELNKKISSLKKDINDFQNKRKQTNEKFNTAKLEKTNKMVQNLNAILSKYADDNDISLIIQKKFIVIGKSGLDVTEEVLKIFNKEVK